LTIISWIWKAGIITKGWKDKLKKN
jgi:hypothetical protein